MPLDLDEIADLIPEAERLVIGLRAALRRDPDGKVRIDRAERRELARLAGALALHLGRDIIDGPKHGIDMVTR